MPEEAGTSLSEGLRRHRVLLGVMALALLGHLVVFVAAPPPTFFEDEPHYNLYAHLDVRAGNTSLLPGRLRFDQRPELISRLWAQFLTQEDVDAAPSTDTAKRSLAVWRRARYLNLVLFLALIPILYGQARALGLGPLGANTSAAVLALFPWFGFYVHALWAEQLHAFLVGVAFLTVFRRLTGASPAWLLPGGAATGVALLAKGTLNPFLPVFLGFLALTELLRKRAAEPAVDPGWPARIGRALLAPALFGLGTFAVVGPQLIANQANGHGFRIAGNRWKNLEMGLLLEPRERQDVIERIDRAKLHETYMRAGDDYEVREAAARDRTLAYVDEVGLGSVARDQGRKLAYLLFATPSFFERALVERWGDPAPGWLRAAKVPGRCLWTLLVLLGPVGIALALRRAPGWILCGLFVGFFGAAALVIPYKVRFLIPVVPVLCLGLGSVVEASGRWVARRRSVAEDERSVGDDQHADAQDEEQR